MFLFIPNCSGHNLACRNHLQNSIPCKSCRKFQGSSSPWYHPSGWDSSTSSPPMAALLGTCGLFLNSDSISSPISPIKLSYGSSSNSYCIYSWWSIFLFSLHIRMADCWCGSVSSNVSWFVGQFFKVPYHFFMCQPRKPPYGPLLHIFMFLGIALIYYFLFGRSFYRIFGLKLGFITLPLLPR